MGNFTEQEIDSILNNLIPQIASDEDAEFFRGIIGLQLREGSKADGVKLIEKLLKFHA